MRSQLATALQRWSPGTFALLLRVLDRYRPLRGEPEQVLLPLICPRDELAVDIGANHGSYTGALLGIVDQVVTVEPIPNMVAVLKRRFGPAVAAGRLKVVHAALSDKPGWVTLFIPRDATALASVEASATAGQAGETVTVRAETLDGMAPPRTGFVKIDVEGHEVAVLAGAMGTVARDLPSMLIEIEERHHAGSLADIRGRLEPLGYAAFFMIDGRLRPIADFDPGAMQNVASLNEAGTARRENSVYVNNFLFVARPEVLQALRKGGWLRHD